MAAWLGTGDGGAYYMSTYTYTDMFGKGNPNIYKSIKHEEKHKQWHFIYFAYSKEKRSAFSSINFVGKK